MSFGLSKIIILIDDYFARIVSFMLSSKKTNFKAYMNIKHHRFTYL